MLTPTDGIHNCRRRAIKVLQALPLLKAAGFEQTTTNGEDLRETLFLHSVRCEKLLLLWEQT